MVGFRIADTKDSCTMPTLVALGDFTALEASIRAHVFLAIDITNEHNGQADLAFYILGNTMRE